VLEPLLREREASATGRGRFLLRASPILGRSLRARWWRWVGRAFGPWDGLVDPEGASREALRGQGLGERPYSPTALQGFAACPYRFHLHSLVGLRPRDEIGPLEELDPLTRGQIFHEAQARYLRALQAEELLPLLPDRVEEALDRLDRELDAVTTTWEETLCPALPRVWASEMEALRQDLRGWVREMVAEGGEWTPSHFELAFGLPAGEERDTASVPDPVRVLDRVLLRGSIDLVEARGDGTIRVTDHKTGRPPDTERIAIGGGERLQPQLYSLAASAILDRPVHSGGLYFCTRRGGYRRYEVRFGEPFARHALESLLDLIGDWVEAGFLPAAPREGACRWCDYRMVCGPNEERRTRRKGRDRLEPLHALREEA
jgi:RecB family exonuclease